MDVSCTDLVMYAFLPVGLIVLLINSFFKKDYQISVFLLATIVMSMIGWVDLYERHSGPMPPPPPAIPYQQSL